MTATDAHVIQLARRARDEALALLYETYRGKIFTFLLRLTGDADAADDLTQDTFMKARRALGGLSDGHRLLPWLYRIAANAAIDAARRRKRLAWVPLLSLDGDHEPHHHGEHHGVADRDHIRAVLRELPVENAAALLLHALEGYSYREIAAIQGASLTAVRSRIARARAAFRAVYATRTDAKAFPGATKAEPQASSE